MATNDDWYPRSLPKQREMYAAILANIDEYSGKLNLSAAQVTRIKAIANAFIAAYDAMLINRAESKAYTTWFNIILYGNKDGSPTMPSTPTFVNPVMPAGDFVDIVNEMREFREYMKGQFTWTDEIADALKMNTPAESDNLNDEAPLLKNIKVEGNIVTLEWTKGEATAMEFQYMKLGATVWQPLKVSTKSPTTLEFPASVTTQPEKILIRAIRQRNDERIGNWSQFYQVTVG
jgi:hypothetical protein